MADKHPSPPDQPVQAGQADGAPKAGRAAAPADLAADVLAMAAGTRPLPGYDQWMGFRMVAWAPDGATMEADVDGRFANPAGVLHGGVLAGLADSAMGLTVSGLMDPGVSTTNTDLTMRFLRPTTAGRLRAVARVVRKGRRVVAMECDVTDADGRLVARASSTFLVLDGPAG